MAIELYSSEVAAVGARDYYNHNMNKRAVVMKLPEVVIDDYRENTEEKVFSSDITKDVWILFVEN